MEYLGRRNGQNYLEPTGAGFTEHHCSILSWRRATSPDLVLLQFGIGAEFAHLKRTTYRRPHALQVSGSCTPHEIHTHPHDLGSNLSEEDLNRLRIMYPDRYRSQGARQAWRSPDGLAEEQPLAYKDVDIVVDVVHRAGLSLKVARLRPLGVIKG